MAAALPAIYLCNTTDTVNGGVVVDIERDAPIKRYSKWIYETNSSPVHFSYRTECFCFLLLELGMLVFKDESTTDKVST